jgi:anaerobic magnesium-protoporphyrin IX monomethyl ester cyclase
MQPELPHQMTKGKVLLVVHDVYQQDNHFPMGPAYLASFLRREGADVRVYCQDVFHYPNSHLENYLQGTHFDIIGLGFLDARFKETVEPLCKVINHNKKDAWFVLGGHGPSPIPEYILKTTRADAVAIGEADETIVDLLDRKLSGAGLEGVEGIAYRRDEEVIVNKRRRPIKDLDSIPPPAWDLFPMERYLSCYRFPGQDETERSFAILTTRGCVGACSFCYRMEKGIRWRSVDRVLKEMRILQTRYDVAYFVFLDELTMFNKKRVFEFADAFEKSDLKIKFLCDARADILADRDVATCLKKMGCQWIGVGFESMDQGVLDLMNKGTTVEQNIRAAENCKEIQLPLVLNAIWAHPGDTRESLRKLVDFIKKYNFYSHVRTIRPVTPYPGSPLYYDAVRKGLLTGPEDFFEKFKNSDLITVNLTEIPTDECYKMLFEANQELILDHFEHTNGDMQEAKRLIDSFHELYFAGGYKFRGARHYDRGDSGTTSTVPGDPAET